MKYITIAEMADTIRKNFYKIPHDIDFVIGIPRSGVLCGSIISELLNVPLIDVDSFVFGAKPTGGRRLEKFYIEKNKNKKKVLVVDDTIFAGTTNKEVRNKLKPFENEYDFIYLVVFLEGTAVNSVDIYLEDVRKYTENFTQPVLYEWNIFHHYEKHTSNFIYDFDGVFCVNPPDERNEKEYIEYIKNAVPLFIPSSKIGEIVTYRLIKNKEITENWLKKYNICYDKLTMFNAQTWEERKKSGVSPEKMKGDYYKQQELAELFVESDDYQARRIFEISGKPVYCVESNKLYSK